MGVVSQKKEKQSANHNTENIVSHELLTNCLTEQIVYFCSVVRRNTHWGNDGKMK